jgi:hypothetical protein
MIDLFYSSRHAIASAAEPGPQTNSAKRSKWEGLGFTGKPDQSRTRLIKSPPILITCNHSRSQPHVYSELTRYGLHKNLKPSVAMMQPESSTHSFSSSSPPEPVDPEETFNAVDRLTQQFLSIDGETSRTLMPYPHDPQREPRLWAKYDHLTMAQRLNMIDSPGRERGLFEAYMGLCGLGKPDDVGFTEVLRWYALSGHSMAAMYEQTSVYKLGKGGMTSFARALLSDVHADRLMSTQVVGISQANGQVYIRTKSGHEITARAVVSTIPL